MRSLLLACMDDDEAPSEHRVVRQRITQVAEDLELGVADIRLELFELGQTPRHGPTAGLWIFTPHGTEESWNQLAVRIYAGRRIQLPRYELEVSAIDVAEESVSVVVTPRGG